MSVWMLSRKATRTRVQVLRNSSIHLSCEIGGWLASPPCFATSSPSASSCSGLFSRSSIPASVMGVCLVEELLNAARGGSAPAALRSSSIARLVEELLNAARAVAPAALRSSSTARLVEELLNAARAVAVRPPLRSVVGAPQCPQHLRFSPPISESSLAANQSPAFDF